MSKGKHQHRLKSNSGDLSARLFAQDMLSGNSLAHDGEAMIKRERQIARELRQTAWWKNKLQKPICHYCQQQVAVDRITMDHLVPLSSGGRSVKSNLVLCCKECNNLKKDRLSWEFDSSLRETVID